MENKSDVLIIGGGPAGYLAAERLSQGGLSVSLFEKESLGGVCLNEGCIPTKTYLNSAKIYDYALNGAAYGVTAENVTFNHDTVYKRKQKVVKILVAGVNQKMKAHKVNVIKSAARLLPKENGLFACEADGNTYYGTYLMIASGSEPIIPPIPGLQEAYKAGTTVSSREILELRKIPDKLTVIGGGVVGLEMAAYFNSAGSQVTVVEMLDKIAGYTDKEISELLLKDLQKKRHHIQAKF